MKTDSPLNARRIASALAGQEIGSVIQIHEELASTNDFTRHLGETGHPHGTVVFAEHQTAGRGRRENGWAAGTHKNLLLSVLLRSPLRPEFWPRITTLAALALCRAIESHTPLRPSIKWPNDVYLGPCKCAGILAESFQGGASPFLVLGIGLNVNEDAFPGELQSTATSLQIAAGHRQDRDVLAISLLKQLGVAAAHWQAGFDQIVQEVRHRSLLLGRRITARVNDLTVEGMAEDLDGSGHLLLRKDSGEWVTLTSAEQVRLCP
jgi:BirA family biotin operon repressor/biotin-[acetyl-CoA-carboxylase] ligase